MTQRKWMMKFAKMHKWVFFAGFLNTTLMTLINLSYPFLNGRLVNLAFYNKDMNSFLELCAIYVCVLFCNQYIVATINNLILSQLVTGFAFDIRRMLFKKILHKEGKELAGMYSGDLINRMNKDTADFVNLIFWSGFWGYSNILHIVFAVGFMFYYNIYLGIFTIILVPTIFLVSNYFKTRLQGINKDMLKCQGKASSYLFEIVKNLQEVKALNIGRNIKNFYLRKITAINKFKVRSGKVGIMAERMSFLITLVGQLTIFIICAIFIANNKIKLGVFVSAVSYFNMAVQYFGALNGKIVEAGKQSVSIQRVVDILNECDENYNENVPARQIEDGLIEFKDVFFAYSEGASILAGVNLRVDPRSIVGIVGMSGEGKTTLVNLICNLYSVDHGEILIDGVNVNAYNLHSLRSQVGVVHQETILYNETLRYNLSFSNRKQNDDLLVEAIDKVALMDFFLSLPDGLDTMLGNGGQSMSGGQKQRLAIARIWVKNPPILIFDEATAFLDSQNEMFIKNTIDNMAEKRTIIIIAHRLSTIRSCDKIAVLSNGMIQGFGTHEQLIKDNDVYKQLFEEQLK